MEFGGKYDMIERERERGGKAIKENAFSFPHAEAFEVFFLGEKGQRLFGSSS